jgi:hypothetical protein
MSLVVAGWTIPRDRRTSAPGSVARQTSRPNTTPAAPAPTARSTSSISPCRCPRRNPQQRGSPGRRTPRRRRRAGAGTASRSWSCASSSAAVRDAAAIALGTAGSGNRRLSTDMISDVREPARSARAARSLQPQRLQLEVGAHLYEGEDGPSWAASTAHAATYSIVGSRCPARPRQVELEDRDRCSEGGQQVRSRVVP